MSTQKIGKLRTLLERVERRRAEPRLVALPGARPLESANTNVASPATSTTARVVPVEPVRAPAADAPSSMPPPALPALDAKVRSSLPPPPRLEPAARRAPSSTIPPVEPATLPPPPRAQTEVMPAVPTRIAPNAPMPFDSAVRVASSPRVDAPKTFGELLELSLSLRPK